MKTYQMGDYEIRVLRDAKERREAEASVLAAGQGLAMAHRQIFAEASGIAAQWFMEIRNGRGESMGGFAIDVNRSRAMPGHLLLRIERFGEGIVAEVLDATVQAVSNLACRKWRILRVNIETFSRHSECAARLNASLARCGFKPVADARRYQKTLLVDLSPDEAAVFASLHGTARRHIRAIAKHPVQIRPIRERIWVPRMNELVRETMDRTGGVFRETNWGPRISMTNENPNLASLLGLFRTDRDGPDSLLAFAWSCMNGDYAHYDAAASTRNTDLKLPLNYAVAWEHIRWAKANGARWYDFGGITAGRNGDQTDRLGGISDFKRYFSKHEIEVGGEWMLEPHWLRAKVARRVSAAAGWLSSLSGRPKGRQNGFSAHGLGDGSTPAAPLQDTVAGSE